MTFGNWGKIIFIDLNKEEVKIEKLNERVYDNFLGGYGLGAKIIYDRTKANINPLGPENVLGFTTGTLVGTPAISGCRFTVCGKSPLTNSWGDANSGGYFGPALKRTGYDAVFFKGIAKKPVYLWISKDEVELRDAENLWGLDTAKTQDILKERLGKEVQIATIGPAGEKLSLISSIIHDKGRAAARSGLGAVMGSKKLKAVVVKGELEVPLANKDKAKELRMNIIKKLSERDDIRFWKKYGTINHVASSTYSNDAPVKNWYGVGVEDFTTAEKISDDEVLKYEVKKYGCWQCPLPCSGIYTVEKGPYIVKEAHKPEYETCGMFGPNLLNDNLESIIMANDLCNRYGLDTISVGSVIGFALECYEKGYLTKEDTSGLELTWGNHEAIVKLVKKIGEREDIGELLADGVKVAAEKLGEETKEFAIHVGGQELAAHDPRYAPSWGLYYKADATPGRHTQIAYALYEIGGGIPGLKMPEEAPKEKYVYSGKGKYQAMTQNIMHALVSSGLCIQTILRVNVEVWPKFLSLITGKNITLDDMEKIGSRIATIRHAFNVREGIRTFKITNRPYGKPPQKSGPNKGVNIDIETMEREYFEAQGWDLETGKPKKEKLEELGLSELIKDFY